MADLAEVLPRAALDEPGDPERWASLGRSPDAVVSPESPEEAAAVLAWASREGVGVVPAGSGRRLGPRRMTDRYLVMTTDRLAGIEIYEPADLTFTAKAGTSVGDIDAALRANRQWLPFDPPDVTRRSLAGLVSCGDSGPLTTGYGAIRNHLLGATVVTGDGRVLRLGGRVVKNVAGFDLLKPIVGGRGTLCFVTSVCMRAFPEPAVARSLELRAETPGELVRAAQAVGTAPVMPVSSTLFGDAGGAVLTVLLHGALETVDADQRTLEEHTGADFEVGERGAGAAAAGGGGSPASPGPEESPHGAPVLVASVLPSRLAQVLAAVDAVVPTWVSIDTYAADLRFEVGHLDREAIVALRAAIEGLGGALGIEHAPVGVDVTGLATRPNSAERTLAGRVRSVFDPVGVLWRDATS